jgi:protein-disulfide isomerase
MRITTVLFAGVFTLMLAAQSGRAQSNEIRKDLEALKAGQKAIQKELEIIRGMLSGKQPPLENVIITLDGAPSKGDKDAKVTMVEFSDYQCPFCGRYVTQTLTQVMDEYVKTGKVKYVFRDFPLEQLHPQAFKAAEAAHCSGEQGKYWEMHDRLFQNQKALDVKELAGHATVLELDMPKFQTCLSSGKYGTSIRKALEEGQKYGVRGTPAFFLGLSDPKDSSKLKAVTFVSGAQPFSAFKEAIDKLLAPPKEEGKDSSE